MLRCDRLWRPSGILLMQNKTVCIIPVRMASSRLPGKPLKLICGIPMLAHCIYRAQLVFGDDVFVATCDEELARFAGRLNCKHVITSKKHERASSRTAEALGIIERMQNRVIDSVVMLQGDEPLVLPESLRECAHRINNQSAKIVNLKMPIMDEDDAKKSDNVKVVCDLKGRALYFSRSCIPHSYSALKFQGAWMQTGIIGFSREALIEFEDLPPTFLEAAESVDLNRVIEHGGSVMMLPINYELIGVDTNDDLIKANTLMATRIQSSFIPLMQEDS